jgi:hypothetical protein
MAADIHGLAISTRSPEAAQAFDRTVLAYLKYRTDTPRYLAAVLAADPEFALAHCVHGYFAMLAYNRASVPAATTAATTARRLSAQSHPRERQHVGALEAWVIGDLDGALAIWEDILAEYPLDIVAFRLAHSTNF